jgi:Mg-chelatase subunit ChlI
LKGRKLNFPFTAIVGQEQMKLGLILNAINPRLSGILIRGEKGTAKSIAVRALAALLPEIEVVKGCPFNCDPLTPGKLCPRCTELYSKNPDSDKIPTVKRRTKVVDLPINATEDRVVGTLDIEHAIKKGEKRFEPGVLAEANRGILYVDEVNLLDDHIVDILLDSAAMGVNTVEREGVSYSHPAEFILVGTMNPEEGELRPQLLDRFGLCIKIEGIKDINQRAEVVKRWDGYEQDPAGFLAQWRDAEEELAAKIVAARELLPEVTIPDSILLKIADLAVEIGVDGHRSDLTMMKAARTIAAFLQLKEVGLPEVEEAAELSLLHRARRKQFEQLALDREKIKEILANDQPPQTDQLSNRRVEPKY